MGSRSKARRRLENENPLCCKANSSLDNEYVLPCAGERACRELELMLQLGRYFTMGVKLVAVVL